MYSVSVELDAGSKGGKVFEPTVDSHSVFQTVLYILDFPQGSCRYRLLFLASDSNSCGETESPTTTHAAGRAITDDLPSGQPSLEMAVKPKDHHVISCGNPNIVGHSSEMIFPS